MNLGPPIDDAERLIRGPAYGNTLSTLNSENGMSWPSFRNDVSRRSATAGMVNPPFRISWMQAFGGRVSSATATGDRLFISEVDAHTVHAMDIVTGKYVWSYQAGGRVDSPPTLAGGYVVFGARDGIVYCVRATDGTTGWRDAIGICGA